MSHRGVGGQGGGWGEVGPAPDPGYLPEKWHYLTGIAWHPTAFFNR